MVLDGHVQSHILDWASGFRPMGLNFNIGTQYICSIGIESPPEQETIRSAYGTCDLSNLSTPSQRIYQMFLTFASSTPTTSFSNV
ncbi:hypothetical protein H2248_002281 [Termitomyces sp. 'cryptogamus']|nr:hypothetical protein H2248_002281 [Termitomyces sp. 'cryptogamus']